MAKEIEIDTYELKIQQVNAIAHPLASKKLTKKVVKTIKKGNIKIMFIQSNKSQTSQTRCQGSC
jgi:hypothetical protein